MKPVAVPRLGLTAIPAPLLGATLLALAALVAVLLLLGNEIWRDRATRLDQLRASAENRAILTAQHVDGIVAQIDVALSTLAFQIERRGGPAAEEPLHPILARLLPAGGCITTVDPAGQLASTTCSRAYERTVTAAALSDHVEARVMTSVSYDPILASVMLRRSVIDREGQFLGLVQVAFDAVTLLGNGRSVGTDNINAVAMRSGEIVAGPELLFAYREGAAARQAVSLLATGADARDAVRMIEAPGMIAAAAQVRTMPLDAVAVAETWQAMSQWRMIALSGGLIAAIVSVGAGLLLLAVFKAERARTAATAELRLKNEALDQSNNGVILCAASGDRPIVYVNAAFERFTGYAAAEAIGRNPRFLQGTDRDQPALDDIRAALADERPVHVTVRNYRKDGSSYYSDVTISPITDAAGRLTHYIGIQQDMTPRVLAEQALEDRLRFEHTLLDTIPLPVFFVDTDGVFIGANRAFEVALGQERGGIAGRLVTEVVADEEAALHDEADRALVRTGGATSYETRIRLADGTVHDIVVKKAAFLNAAARTAGVVGVFSDITDMKRRAVELASLVEQRDRERIRAEEASRAKSNFLACMSHELRTPLNAILGFSEIIHERVFGDDWERYAEYAGDIHDSGSHLLALINDILDLSKIEAGKLDLSPSPIGIEKVVESVVRLVRQRAADHAHALTVDYGDAAGRTIFADDRAVRQILFNLLSNAIKFTPDRGRIAVTCQAEGNDAISIAVSDTGIGIPADRIHLVLKPFERIGDAYTRNQEGTGLGLSLVDSLVKAHNGTLSIQSVLGSGTTVTVTLPATRAAGGIAA